MSKVLRTVGQVAGAVAVVAKFIPGPTGKTISLIATPPARDFGGDTCE